MKQLKITVLLSDTQEKNPEVITTEDAIIPNKTGIMRQTPYQMNKK